MKFISWNVNGFRAVLKKGFENFFSSSNADIFCIQETKMQPGQADFAAEGYEEYYNSAVRKGYSGTALFTKNKPLNVVFGIDGNHTDEGRVITAEYEDFYFVCAYVPNAKPGLERIDYRMQFEDDLRAYFIELDKFKPIVYCGDLNVAHEDIDLTHPETNHNNPGFSDQERGKLNDLLNSGFTDSFRFLYPDKKEAYTWWSYRRKDRDRNVGWRIDYFLVSNRLQPKIKNVILHNEVLGSDHCPIELDLEI